MKKTLTFGSAGSLCEGTGEDKRKYQASLESFLGDVLPILPEQARAHLISVVEEIPRTSAG